MNNDSMVGSTAVAEDLPFRVSVTTTQVVIADGTVMSLRLWLPDLGPGKLTGTVLEAIPYRKDDVSLIDDETRFGYFAGHGLVCARLDLRGSGNSGGVLVDEYTPTEQQDIVEVIDWLSRQSWSNGNVGMTGISWSGFNALQVAGKRPPALKTIITVCSTDDRYDNDVHYLGGSPLAFYMNLWGSALHLMNMRPPMADVMGEDWLSEWKTRLAANTDMTSLWLSHPRRDAYWRQGSVGEDPDAITCPVLAVGGWADAYTDTVFRLLGDHAAPVHALIGPWGHTWPERPEPGPGIDFLGYCLRWWRRWLNDEQNGVEDDPELLFYLQDYTDSREDLETRPGEWLVATDHRAISRPSSWYLAPGGVLAAVAPGPSTQVEIGDPTVGVNARHYLPMGASTDLPPVQNQDDERSVVFDSSPLEEPFSIAGRASLEIRLATDTPRAFVFVRITDVDEEGRSHLVARGSLNLTHRRGHGEDEVEPIVPGKIEDYVIAIKSTAYRFPAGHRIRVALSTSYWPWIWPSPEITTLSIELGASRLVVPELRTEAVTPLPQGALGTPVISAPPQVEHAGSSRAHWTVTRDDDGTVSIDKGSVGPVTRTLRNGWTFGTLGDHTTWTLTGSEASSAVMTKSSRQLYRWREHRVEISTATKMTGYADLFQILTRSTATLDGATVWAEDVTHVVPRDL